MSVEITLENDGSADPVHRILVPSFRSLHAAINHRPMGQNGCEPFVFKTDRRFRKCRRKTFQKNVHIGCGFRRLSVQVSRITHDKSDNGFPDGVILKIFYYLCTWHGFEGGCEYAQGIAGGDASPFSSVVYSDYSVHYAAKLIKYIEKQAGLTGMASRKIKRPRVENFRITLVDDLTHKQLWVKRFTRTTVVIAAVSALVVISAACFSIVAFTPLRTLIPGYPDAHTRRVAVNNAIRIDSLENVICTWKFYVKNLQKVMEGADPVAIDSIVHNAVSADGNDAGSRNELDGRDSLLRENVRKAEQFGLDRRMERNLPIEGIHFFTPLKGVVSQGYDPIVHPYIDITAPANSVVMSVLDGTVINAGWSDDSGYTIQIQHSDDIVSIYKHNQKLLKKTGDKVTAGTPVALVGNTGAITTGDHLHFELWYRGEAVDPAKYINF